MSADEIKIRVISKQEQSWFGGAEIDNDKEYVIFTRSKQAWFPTNILMGVTNKGGYSFFDMKDAKSIKHGAAIGSGNLGSSSIIIELDKIKFSVRTLREAGFRVSYPEISNPLNDYAEHEVQYLNNAVRRAGKNYSEA